MNSAVLSPCGLYRYRLDRDTNPPDLLDRGSGIVIAYFGINPSTADATIDDQTVRKWRGFAVVQGACRFIVGNVFGFRATDVNALARAADPVGPDNAVHLRAIVNEADMLVPCWGAMAKVPEPLWPHLDAMRCLLFASGKPVKTFGLTGSGDPKHVLRLGYSTPLIEWAPRT